jgi:lipopolysaccharide transport system ATP-binding protein
VRLAFAVAAHLESEILLVDEVLAVGDAAFQKKCLGKMGDVAKEGRTVLFVSHNTSAIQRLCPRSMLLDKGKQVMWGRTTEVLVGYLSDQAATIPPAEWVELTRDIEHPPRQAWFVALRYSSEVVEIGNHAYVDGPLEVVVRVMSDSFREVGSMAVTFYDEHGTKLVNCDTVTIGLPIQLSAGQNEFAFRISELHLNPGIYTVGLWLANVRYSVLDRIDSAARLEVIDALSTQGGVRPAFDGAVSSSFTLIPTLP